MKSLIDTSYSTKLRTCTRIAALCWVFLLPQNAYSTINACRLADGTVTFQDTACPVIPKAKVKKAPKKAAIPFGIEKTWFDMPAVVPDRAICTDSGCHCGMFSRKFKNGLPLAIADALYLDGSWHRLDSTIVQLQDESLSSIAQADLRKARDEAACNILMSQQVLRSFGDDVLRELRDKKRYAEDRGLDDPAECDAGDTLVCSYTDLIMVYERIQSDIKAMRGRARIESDDETVANSDAD